MSDPDKTELVELATEAIRTYLGIPHGFRLYFREQFPHFPSRMGLVLKNERGAVEVWHHPTGQIMQELTGARFSGQVDTHSPEPYDPGDTPTNHDCDILGGVCYTDQSSLAFNQHVLPLLDQGNAKGIFDFMLVWHGATFD